MQSDWKIVTNSVNTKSDPSEKSPLAEGSSTPMPGIHDEAIMSDPVEETAFGSLNADDADVRPDIVEDSFDNSANKEAVRDDFARSATTVALPSDLEAYSISNSSKNITFKKMIFARVAVVIVSALLACVAVFAINFIFSGEEGAPDLNQGQSYETKGFASNETKSDPTESENSEEDASSEDSDSGNTDSESKTDTEVASSTGLDTFSHGGSVGENNSNSQVITVNVSVYGHGVSGGGTFSFEPGATAYDALMACGLSVNAKNTVYGIYVAAIGGVAEKQYGDKSGWLYAVNGNTPNIACSGYVLDDGDSVSWFYTDGN